MSNIANKPQIAPQQKKEDNPSHNVLHHVGMVVNGFEI